MLSGYGFTTTSQQSLDTSALSYTLASAAVPEPASWALLVAGFGIVGAAARRRRIAVAA